MSRKDSTGAQGRALSIVMQVEHLETTARTGNHTLLGLDCFSHSPVRGTPGINSLIPLFRTAMYAGSNITLWSSTFSSSSRGMGRAELVLMLSLWKCSLRCSLSAAMVVMVMLHIAA